MGVVSTADVWPHEYSQGNGKPKSLLEGSHAYLRVMRNRRPLQFSTPTVLDKDLCELNVVLWPRGRGSSRVISVLVVHVGVCVYARRLYRPPVYCNYVNCLPYRTTTHTTHTLYSARSMEGFGSADVTTPFHYGSVEDSMRHSESLEHRLRKKYWKTKQTVLQKLGKNQDEFVVAGDQGIDSKLEVSLVGGSI